MAYLIHTERGIVPQYRRHIRQEQPAILGPGNRGLLVKNRSAALGHERPDENRQPRNGHDDGFGDKQPPDFIRVDAQERKLQNKKD